MNHQAHDICVQGFSINWIFFVNYATIKMSKVLLYAVSGFNMLCRRMVFALDCCGRRPCVGTLMFNRLPIMNLVCSEANAALPLTLFILLGVCVLEKKEHLRAVLKSVASQLPSDRKNQAANALLEHVQQHFKRSPFDALCLYQAMDHEISSRGVAQWALKQGIKIYFPVIYPAFQMEYNLALNIDFDQVSKPTRINAVSGKMQMHCDFSVQTLVVVPCVGLDRAGYRIGSGYGYFDRYFARCSFDPTCVQKVFCAYQEVMVERIDFEPFDIPADIIWVC